MDKSYFDRISDYDWDLESADHGFDRKKIEEYLSLLNEEDRPFIRELLNNTIYVKYYLFKKALFESFEKFKGEIRDEEFYLILPARKIGSEHWLSMLLWNQLRRLNIKGIIDDDTRLPLKKTNIVIIDDAIYSGANISATIDVFLFKLSQSNKVRYNESGKHFIFHIIAPFVNSRGINAMSKTCEEMDTKCNIYSTFLVPIMPDLINIRKYYLDPHETLYKKFGIESIDLPAIYFDHKVAGTMSTFSTIYLEGRVPNKGAYGDLFKKKPSREKISGLKRLLEKS